MARRSAKTISCLCVLLAAACMTMSASLPAEAAEKSSNFALEQEKQYLLEALDELQEMGLSPILIWSEITKDQRVLDAVGEVSDTVTDAVTEKVSEAGDAAVQAVSDAARAEAEKAKKNLLELLKEQIRDFLEHLFDKGGS